MYLSQESVKSINNICSAIGFSLLFGGALIQAIVSNCYIEPKIEKRLGVKLQYMPIWRAMPLFGYFLGRNTELVMYIVPSYSRWKLKGDANIIKVPWNCLYRANYRIQNASKSEIIFACIVVANGLIAFSTLIIGSLVQFIF